MAAPRSPAIAFQPTPNDALIPPVLSSETSSPPSMAIPIPHRESVSSASRIPANGSNRPSRARSPDVSPFQHPITAQDGFFSVRSIAAFPPLDSTGSSTASDDSWREMYNQGQELLEHERQLWKKERLKLSADIARLEKELLVAKTKLKQQELAAQDPASYVTRVLSNGTSRSDSRQSMEENAAPLMPVNPAALPPTIAMTYGSPARFSNGTSRLPSIKENDRTPRASSKSLQRSTSLQSRRPPRFSSLDSALSTAPPVKRASLDDRFEGSPGFLRIQEIPYSPPPTHAPLSPAPAEYRRHAGHTPGIGEALSRDRTPGYYTPTKLNTEQNMILTQSHESDEDPPLTGPLMLPTNPDEDSGTLTHLERRLQDVTENPLSRRPTVLQGVESTDGESIAGDASEIAIGKEGKDGDKTPAATQPTDEPPGGILLKTKASMNFGAPLGKLHV